MITIPSVLNYKNVSVYPDDEDCNLFYTFKNSPEITLQNGQPVFSGLFWTDAADGAATSVAGIAGGWINFDANLAVPQDLLNEISEKLKSARVQENRRRTLIKSEKERLALIAKASGATTIPDPDIPPVGEIRFGAVNFTKGTVTLLEEQGGDLVAWSSAGGPASLIGDNNAAFALRLSPTGAAIWYKSLKEGQKAISIRYELKFQLRLPSLEIRAWAGSSQSGEINREVERKIINMDQGCSDADVERIDVKSVTRTLMETGLVNIEIKKGATEISDENVSQLRSLAIGLIEEKVKEIIKSRIQGMSEEERKNSLLQLVKEEVNSFVELRFTQQDVVEWSINPQGTIMNFLEKVPESKKQAITRLVDMSEKEVETISLQTKVNAPWEEEPFVNTVKVNIAYPSANEHHSLIFNKDSPIDTWHFRRPKKDDGIAEYTAEVFFKGLSQPLVTKGKAAYQDIVINVARKGMFDVRFKPHPILSTLTGDNEIKIIQIDLSYKQEGDPDHFSETLALKTETPDGEQFRRLIGKEIDAPLVYTAKYYSKDGSFIEMPEKKYYATENAGASIFVESPYQNTLNIPVELAQLPDESVKKIIVEFQYDDAANKFSSADRIELTAEDSWEAVTATLLLMNKDKADFRYQYKIVSNAAIAKSAWINGSGEETIILPYLKVRIDPSLLQLGTRYVNALLTMEYQNGDAAISQEFLLNQQSAAAPVNWYLPRSNTNAVEYTYKLVLMDAAGAETETGGKGTGSILMLKTA
ncbi:hypothetical protein [Niabella aurantiaca]|uniref:hypothetical protein n=1 Tax=Niabella aurantiaca TaxID=379900 RepID=UPI0003724958|nr:hypothetical protein [Niabella aurantiaca]